MYAVCGGEWGRSRDRCIKWGADRQRGRGSFRVNVGHPIVINGYFVAYLFSAVRGGDAALSKLLWDFLLLLTR